MRYHGGPDPAVRDVSLRLGPGEGLLVAGARGRRQDEPAARPAGAGARAPARVRLPDRVGYGPQGGGLRHRPARATRPCATVAALRGRGRAARGGRRRPGARRARVRRPLAHAPPRRRGLAAPEPGPGHRRRPAAGRARRPLGAVRDAPRDRAARAGAAPPCWRPRRAPRGSPRPSGAAWTWPTGRRAERGWPARVARSSCAWPAGPGSRWRWPRASLLAGRRRRRRPRPTHGPGARGRPPRATARPCCCWAASSSPSCSARGALNRDAASGHLGPARGLRAPRAPRSPPPRVRRAHRRRSPPSSPPGAWRSRSAASPWGSASTGPLAVHTLAVAVGLAADAAGGGRGQLRGGPGRGRRLRRSWSSSRPRRRST